MPMSDHIRNLRAKIGNDLLMMPGATAVVLNEDGEILLQRRSDNGEWALPAGAIDPGEEPAETVVREVYEETGLHVIPERIVGVYGGADHMMTYPNGDQVAIITIVFLCHPVGGELRVNDDESLEVGFFSPDALPPMHERYYVRIRAALNNELLADFRMPPHISG